MKLIWNGKADTAIGAGVSFAITGDHDNRITDMTNLLVYERDRTDSPREQSEPCEDLEKRNMQHASVLNGDGRRIHTDGC